MGEKRDETPFASLLGERLSSVEFVLNDYVQLRFDGPTLNAYSHSGGHGCRKNVSMGRDWLP
jgi:hypothetical protein